MGAPLIGRLADKRSSKAVVGLAIALNLAAFVIFWLAGGHLMGLILGVVVMDLGTQVAMISNQARIYSLLPDSQSRFLWFVTSWVGRLVLIWVLITGRSSSGMVFVGLGY